MTAIATLAPGYVYLAADINGALLYVGSTGNLRRRMQEHKRDAPWWPESATFIAAVVADRELAYDFERSLIGGMRPLHNVQSLNEDFPVLPPRATAADVEAIGGLLVKFVRFSAERLDAYRSSMAAFEHLRSSEDETVGECQERLRARGPVGEFTVIQES